MEPFASPDECEAAFYAAFRDGDLGAMKRVWSPEGEIVCIHPARPPLAGHEAVMKTWQEILGNSGGVHVSFDCRSRTHAAELAVHVGIEVISSGENEPAFVSVTNIYGLTAQGWKLRLHHAGPIHRGVNKPARQDTMH